MATGGRQISAEGGNIYDNFHIAYEYPNNVICHLGSRQQRDCYGENHDYINGTKGTALIVRGNCVIRGDENWRAGADLNNDMYQTEHNELLINCREVKLRVMAIVPCLLYLEEWQHTQVKK